MNLIWKCNLQSKTTKKNDWLVSQLSMKCTDYTIWLHTGQGLGQGRCFIYIHILFLERWRGNVKWQNYRRYTSAKTNIKKSSSSNMFIVTVSNGLIVFSYWALFNVGDISIEAINLKIEQTCFWSSLN